MVVEWMALIKIFPEALFYRENLFHIKMQDYNHHFGFQRSRIQIEIILECCKDKENMECLLN